MPKTAQKKTASKTKASAIVTPVVTVKWSALKNVDVFRKGRTHNISVVRTDELDALLTEVANSMNIEHINGLKDDVHPETGEVTPVAKFTTRKFADGPDNTPFPNIWDSSGKQTTQIPFGGDKVRLKLWPSSVPDDDGSQTLSFRLLDVQIIEKISGSSGSRGFEAMDGGWVDGETNGGSDDDAESVDTTDKIPF